VDATLNPLDDSFEPISLTEAFTCLDNPDKLRGKDRIRIVFDVSYFVDFDTKITKYLASNADLQSRVTAIVAAMRESARIQNPIAASDPFAIIVHARIGDQFKLKLKYSMALYHRPIQDSFFNSLAMSPSNAVPRQTKLCAAPRLHR
jgi:hypothetical protein